MGNCIGTRWALRQKSTGFYIPAPTRGTGVRAGISEFEPSPTKTPALYASEKAAKNALKVWLNGIHRSEPITDRVGNWESYKMTVTPVASRRADDMEVVAVKLMVEA